MGVVVAILLLPVSDAAWSRLERRGIQTHDGVSFNHTDVYDKSVRPKGDLAALRAGPLPVTIDVYLRYFKICDQTMEYTVQATVRHQWRDERLAFASKNQGTFITMSHDNEIWTPDTFFSNELDGRVHDVMRRNVLVRIYPDGTIQHSARVTLKQTCPLDHRGFPFDSQVCSIVPVSYAYTTEDVTYQWRKENPVQVTKHLSTEPFVMEKYSTDYCASKTRTGTYPCLKANFWFSRNPHYVIVSVYVPCIMLVFLSWVPLWLEPQATLVRFLVPLLVLLAMANTIVTLRHHLFPHAGYTMSADVWTGTCLGFVFVVLIQVTVVHYLMRNARNGQQKLTGNSEEEPVVVLPLEVADEKVSASKKTSYWASMKTFLKRKRSASEWVHLGSRIAFPAAFAFFGIIYKCCYTRYDLSFP